MPRRAGQWTTWTVRRSHAMDCCVVRRLRRLTARAFIPVSSLAMWARSAGTTCLQYRSSTWRTGRLSTVRAPVDDVDHPDAFGHPYGHEAGHIGAGRSSPGAGLVKAVSAYGPCHRRPSLDRIDHRGQPFGSRRASSSCFFWATRQNRRLAGTACRSSSCSNVVDASTGTSPVRLPR